MTCDTCGDKPKKCGNCNKDFPRAVIEIDNPETLVLLRKVVIPASMGTEEQVPPAIGKYHNVILYYEANRHVYLYSSDGIPTLLETDIPQEIIDRIETLEDNVNDLNDAIDDVEQEIEDLKNSPDVVDIVSTYADLQAYDTSSLGDNDIIRVLQDETHDGQSAYYKWDKTASTWTFIGTVGDYYTKTQTNALLADKQDTLTAGRRITIDSSNEISADGLVTLSYGNSTWNDFLTAYNNSEVVYCRASSNQDPSQGTQTRLAFMAYVNNETNPTEVEFQYLRSVSTKSASNQSDQVFVYKLTNANGGTWTTMTRPVMLKIEAGTNMSSSYSNNTLTLSSTDTTYSDFTGTDGTASGTSGLVPAPAATDAGKVLGADGTWVTGGPMVVQTVGTSTTDVMSQNATTNMVFADPGTRAGIAIGEGATARIATGYYPTVIGSDAHAGGANYAAGNSIVIGRESTSMSTNGISIGYKANTPSSTNSISIGTEARANASSGYAIAMGASAKAGGGYSVAIGYKAETQALNGQSGQVALGAFSVPTQTGQVDISLVGATAAQKTAHGYAGSGYRLLTGLYDPQNAHDAANKEYVDSLIAALESRISALENA